MSENINIALKNVGRNETINLEKDSCAIVIKNDGDMEVYIPRQEDDDIAYTSTVVLVNMLALVHNSKNHSYKFFSNTFCDLYPCHNKENQNCLFCFCPLYHMEDCDGEFTLNEFGQKDCSKCTKPHDENGYYFVMDKMLTDES